MNTADGPGAAGQNPEAPGPKPPMTKRVLIVDDALIMRRRIKDIAEQAGWQAVGEAKNGEEAVAMHAQFKPDLTTLDIVMPSMDGVEALKRIRAADPQAKIVMVSAVDQRQKLAECIEAGALDFVVKPFEKAALLSMFQTYLAEPSGRRES